VNVILTRTPRSTAGARFTPLGGAPSEASSTLRAGAALSAVVTFADISTAAVSGSAPARRTAGARSQSSPRHDVRALLLSGVDPTALNLHIGYEKSAHISPDIAQEARF